MGQEIDLMRNYPKSKRDLKQRVTVKTAQHRAIARQFGKEFFDGTRDTGYGGFGYSEKFWQPVIPDIQAHFNLQPESSLLDVGCAKGFMLVDLKKQIPGLTLHGVDISTYALEHGHPDVIDNLSLASCDDLPFADNSFDVVISITTVHNMDYDGCVRSLREIERVAKRGAFITVDAYRDSLEKERMEAWNLTAQTILHVDAWKELFKEAGYTGDYYWFIP